jgi:hypothetical protein
MAQPTKNPMPSGNILDQIFNAEKFDEFVGSSEDYYTDRFGVKRFTIAGLNKLSAQSNANAISSLGFYEDGVIQVRDRNQLIRYSDVLYQINPDVTLPFTTTGTDATSWANDSSKFTPVGAGKLSYDLQTDLGGQIVSLKINKTSSKKRTSAEKATDRPNLLDWDTDSQSDDSMRLRKALVDGIDHIQLPGVLELGRPIYFGEVDISTALRFEGVGSQGFNRNGSVIIKASGAAYGMHFNGVGAGTRPAGGGLYNVHLSGQASADTGPLVKVTSWSYFKAINVGFNNISDYGLRLKDVMESTISGCLFRRLGSNSTGCILLDDYLTSQNNNVNNLHIVGCTFGLSSGEWIKATPLSNIDVVWIQNNKFEYDDTPISPNTDPQYVIDLGKAAKTFIDHNTFTYFNTPKNNYAGILRMQTQCLSTTMFTNNQMFGCEGNAGLIEGGSLFARDNFNTLGEGTGTIGFSVTSTKRQDIEDVFNIHNNGNLVSRPKAPTGNFISCHKLSGTVANLFTPDPGATYWTAMSVPASTEIRRFQLPGHLLNEGAPVRVRVRVKCTDTAGADGSVQIIADDTTLSASTVTASAGWQTVEFLIKGTLLTSGVLKIMNSGTVSVLFDGIYYEKAEYVDWNFAFPVGTLTPGQQLTSDVQSSVDIVGIANKIKGCGGVWFNSSAVGLLFNPSTYQPGNSFRVIVYNPGAANVVTSITRCTVRVIL